MAPGEGSKLADAVKKSKQPRPVNKGRRHDAGGCRQRLATLSQSAGKTLIIAVRIPRMSDGEEMTSAAILSGNPELDKAMGFAPHLASYEAV